MPRRHIGSELRILVRIEPISQFTDSCQEGKVSSIDYLGPKGLSFCLCSVDGINLGVPSEAPLLDEMARRRHRSSPK